MLVEWEDAIWQVLASGSGDCPGFWTVSLLHHVEAPEAAGRLRTRPVREGSGPSLWRPHCVFVSLWDTPSQMCAPHRLPPPWCYLCSALCTWCVSPPHPPTPHPRPGGGPELPPAQGDCPVWTHPASSRTSVDQDAHSFTPARVPLPFPQRTLPGAAF